MAKKLSILFLTFVLTAMLVNAQNRVILKADGQVVEKGSISNAEVQPLKLTNEALRDYYSDYNTITDLDLILNYTLPPTGNSNFGFFGQDRMVQWFEAPADMTIHAMGTSCAALDSDGLGAEVKLVSFAWSKDQILNAGVTQWGWYVADGNGYNNITAYLDDIDRTGDWVDFEGSGLGSPFGNDIWSDGGFGAPINPTPAPDVVTYEWVNANLLGFEPEVLGGEIIGVSVKNTQGTMDADRIGWLANSTLGIPGFKFYVNGRNVPGGPGVGDPGWWSREFTWNFALDVTLTGDKAPDIANVTVLGTTVSQEARTVSADITDENPSGGGAGVASATLYYNVNGGDFMEVPMALKKDGTYMADIPGQVPGTAVTYYVGAVDVEGNANQAPLSPIEYNIFLPVNNNLLYINGEADSGYPTDYQMGVTMHDDGYAYWDFDVWAYGQVTDELLAFYDNVFEFALGGPADYANDPVAGAGTGGEEYYRDWLMAKEGRNLFIFGMEWLGSWNGYTDIDFAEGDFVYDVLGIMHSYNDVSYDGASGQGDPSALTLVNTDHPLNAPVIAAGYTETDLSYDSDFEVGYDNWMDGFDPVAKAGTVLMTTTTRGIGGAPDVRELPCAIHNVLGNGNNVLFGTFNPLSVQYDPDGDNGDNYVWVGYEDFFYPYQYATVVCGITPVGVEETGGVMPSEFNLSQNYPNPFNPTTNIKFAIPQSEFVSMKVYDVLGREVTTLVNENLTAGSYEVTFDASKLAAGMYIYQIQAGDFVTSKKMMLLK